LHMNGRLDINNFYFFRLRLLGEEPLSDRCHFLSFY
jgi:hypothetical protein